MYSLLLLYFAFFFLTDVNALQQLATTNPSPDSLLLGAKEDSARVKILLDLSNHYMASDYPKAFELIRKAYQIAVQSEDLHIQMSVNLELGKLYFYKGNYEKAIHYYSEVLKSSSSIKDLEWMAKGYSQLGTVRLVLEDYELAESHFNSSKFYFLEHYQEEQAIPDDIKIKFNNNLGVIYSAMGKYEEGMLQFEQGIELAEKSLKYDRLLVQLLNNMGDIMLKQGLFERAKFFYEEAISRLKINPNYLMESMLYNSLGKLYLDINEPELARQFFSKGYSLVESRDGLSHRKHLSENLSAAFIALGKPDSALIYMNLSKTYADSINIVKSAEKILEKELLIEFAQEKSQLKTFHLRNRNYLLIFVFCVLLVTIVFMIKHLRARRKLKFILDEKFLLERKAQNTFQKNEALQQQIHLNEKAQTIIAINSMQTNQMLEELNFAFKRDKFNNLEPSTQKILDELIKGLKKNKGENALTEFEYRFSKIHVGFFEKLAKNFPDLTLNERRLGAFLKLQLTTKEITGITGQSVRAVEIARTRLRKKLHLTKSEKSLYDFFVEY